MRAVTAHGRTFHVQVDGAPGGVPVLFSNSLGTDLRLWDRILPLLPQGFTYIRYDSRGHGLSDCPPSPYSLDDLAEDAAALIEATATGPVIFVGLSVGGMTGQRLAALRPDLVRALVLSNTAAKMGTPDLWSERISAIRAGGMSAVAGAVLDRWFGPVFRQSADCRLWEAMLTRTPAEGYIATCAAIAAADLTAQTAQLALPALAIAGARDLASPPEAVSATAALIPGTPCHVIEGAGHLPCVEAPEAYAALLFPFLKDHADA